MIGDRCHGEGISLVSAFVYQIGFSLSTSSREKHLSAPLNKGYQLTHNLYS